jgi:hypothetical protein
MQNSQASSSALKRVGFLAFTSIGGSFNYHFVKITIKDLDIEVLQFPADHTTVCGKCHLAWPDAQRRERVWMLKYRKDDHLFRIKSNGVGRQKRKSPVRLNQENKSMGLRITENGLRFAKTDRGITGNIHDFMRWYSRRY